MHASYYARSVGFGLPFEAKVAAELAEFCLRYVPGRDGLWLALEGDVIHGSVAIDGSPDPDAGAQVTGMTPSTGSFAVTVKVTIAPPGPVASAVF